MERTHLVILSHLDFDGQGPTAGSGLRLRAIVHPGGPDVAGGKSNGH